MKQKPIRSPKHLAYIRSLPCCIMKDGLNCNGTPVCAHHLTIIKGSRGISQKAGDCYCVPLCHFHHTTLHNVGEKSFWSAWKIDAIELTNQLWNGDDAL